MQRLLAVLVLAAVCMSCSSTGIATPAGDDDDSGNASSGLATAPPNGGVQAAFEARSYVAGSVAHLDFHGTASTVRIGIFHAGAGHDGVLQGFAVSRERTVHPAGTVPMAIGSWPSGFYYARVVTPGRGTWDAPFVLRPARLGEHQIAIVLPTNTWQAYNDENNDSWYFDPSVTHVQLNRPYLDGGVPPQYHGYDRGFIRWTYLHHLQADYLSDDDLDRLKSGDSLAKAYDLVIFSGHEEYVTAHEYDVTQRYRDLGGNLAFLSANDFFYKVEKSGDTMTGRWRWRDIGRPEAALVGEQYVDWNHGTYPNQPYRVTNTADAPWLFNGTGFGDGTTFGVYGIEVDSIATQSPRDTRVLARIPDIFGPGKSAEMTYYETAAGAKVFSAGVMNFGGSALWPGVRRMIGNIIGHLREA